MRERRKAWEVGEEEERGKRWEYKFAIQSSTTHKMAIYIYIYTFISRVSYSLSFSPLISFPSGLWGRGRITQHTTGRETGRTHVIKRMSALEHS